MLQPYIGYTPLVLILVGVFTFLVVIAADWHVFFRRNLRVPGFVLSPHREGLGNIVIEKVMDLLTTPESTPPVKPSVASFKWRPTRATITSYSGRALALGGKNGGCSWCGPWDSGGHWRPYSMGRSKSRRK